MHHVRTHYKLLLLFCVFALAYVIYVIFAGADPETQARYNISSSQTTALLLTIAVPYIAIWFVALLGYVQLRAYARSIKSSRDGQGFWQISTGVLWLVLWLPLNTLAGNAAEILSERYPAWAATADHATTYIGLVILFAAFFFMNEGSKKVLRLAKIEVYRWFPKVLTLIFLALAGLYIFLALENPTAVSGSDSGQALPTWALIDTVVLPQLLGWYLGLQAAWHLYLYTKFVSGRIYRLALTYLTTGLAVVIFCIILLRYLATMTSITDSGLAVILGAIYMLLIILSAGYMLVTRGARELTRLEQV